MSDASTIDRNIADFGSAESATREQARKQLVLVGKSAVPALCRALESDERRIQWEAAKALKSISSGDAATALAAALEDNDLDIRWLAAETLLGLGRVGLAALLERLSRSNDVHLHENAEHILLRIDTRYGAIAAPVLAALRGPDADEAAMVAAYEAKVALNDL